MIETLAPFFVSLELIFLGVAILKALYSLMQARLNLKRLMFRPESFNHLKSSHITSLVTYNLILTAIEVVATILMAIPLFFFKIQQSKYLVLGFFFWFAAGALEDFTAFLSYRKERFRRKKKTFH